MTAGVVIYLCLLGNLLRAAVCGSQRYLAAKMTNSTGFVALGVFFAFLSGPLSYLAWILPALLLCFLGDFFIGLFRKTRKSRHFMLGLIFFLAAHLGFSLFLLMLHPGIDPFNIGIPLAVGVVFLLVERLCGLKMRKLRWPAFFYALLLYHSIGLFFQLILGRDLSDHILRQPVHGHDLFRRQGIMRIRLNDPALRVQHPAEYVKFSRGDGAF